MTPQDACIVRNISLVHRLEQEGERIGQGFRVSDVLRIDKDDEDLLGPEAANSLRK